MSESEKPFTVKDRRHFTPEGRVREESEAAPDAESPTESSPTSREDPSPAAAPEEPLSSSELPPEPPTSPPPEDDRPAREHAPGEAPGGPAELGQFLFSLGAQAGMLLAGHGLPEGTDSAEVLAGARSIISILEMMETKTEGNRTPEETKILEGLLYELRMAYLEKSRDGGS